MEGLSLAGSTVPDTSLGRTDANNSVAGSGVVDIPSADVASTKDPELQPAAWICVLGALMFLIPSYGFPQAMGTVQASLGETQLPEYSTRDLGWITGLYTALTLFLGIQAGPIVDRYNTMVLAALSTLLTAPMYFILGECTEYWHFVLCLGVFGGIGGALTATLALAVVGKLFDRLRGLAIGVALTGSALGGIIFPFMLRDLLPRWGHTNTMRFLGAMVAGVMVPGCFCFVPFKRIYRKRSGRNEHSEPDPEGFQTFESTSLSLSPPSGTINFKAFLSPAFSAITATFFVLEFAIFGLSGTLPAFANTAGYPQQTGYNIIAIINGGGFVGRIASGFLGDRYGHCNVLFLATISASIMVAATLVPFGTTQIKALYTFAALWGISSGFFSALVPACIGKTCEAKDYGRYVGTLNFSVSLSLLIAVPAGGEMLETLGGNSLSAVYVGVLCIGAVCIFIARSLLAGSWLDFKARM